MCDQVTIEGQLCSTQGELSSTLGGEIVMHSGKFDPRICLCPVDLHATAARYGYLCTFSRDYMDYEFTRRTQHTREAK